MATITGPRYRDLTREESHALLARNHVGRIAFTWHDRVDIEPIHYVNEGNWIFGRTHGGTKLATLLHHPWCAFEIDEVQSLFDWSSVILKGAFRVLDPETGSSDSYTRATNLLRTLVPGTFTSHDPVPDRGIVFGIFGSEITGRTSHH